jgi:hypothetical protein
MTLRDALREELALTGTENGLLQHC